MSRSWADFTGKGYDELAIYVSRKETNFARPAGELMKAMKQLLAAAKTRKISTGTQQALVEDLLDDYEEFCAEQTKYVMKSDAPAGLTAFTLRNAMKHKFNIEEDEEDEKIEGDESGGGDNGKKLKQPRSRSMRSTGTSGVAAISLVFSASPILADKECLGLVEPTTDMQELFVNEEAAWALLILMQKTMAEYACHFILMLVDQEIKQEIALVFSKWKQRREEYKEEMALLPKESYRRAIYDQEIPPWLLVREAVVQARRSTGRWLRVLADTVFITRAAYTTPKAWIQRVIIAKANLVRRGWQGDEATWNKVWTELAV